MNKVTQVKATKAKQLQIFSCFVYLLTFQPGLRKVFNRLLRLSIFLVIVNVRFSIVTENLSHYIPIPPGSKTGHFHSHDSSDEFD